MNPKSDALFERLKSYSLRVVRLSAGLPNSGEAKVLGNQMLRSGTSPGAQYAEARRAKSTKDFISKIEGGLQELEETGYWLQLLTEAKIVQGRAFVAFTPRNRRVNSHLRDNSKERERKNIKAGCKNTVGSKRFLPLPSSLRPKKTVG